ncbi:tetratricopeptide repeat protein [Endozoicomonas ascidiicola]|uniref:tetratricopeptide repeat protein n=1 Tax=Endozoicomonas ascidiicola TaxID=1698521 RepID=UPI00082D1F19|nr:tetratricopeptide repeat protein [Endozoicomonas ascidiicola]
MNTVQSENNTAHAYRRQQSSFNQAIAALKKKQFSRAISLFRQGLPAEANNPNFIASYGSALAGFGLHEQAEYWYQRGRAIAPDHHALLINSGNFYRKQGLFEEAQDCYQKLLQYHGKHKEHLMLMGMLWRDWQRPRQAIQYFNQVRKLDDKHQNVQWELARMHLELGDYQNGFSLFDHRFFMPGFRKAVTDASLNGHLWQGEPLDHKVLLVTHEQGFGDILQFSRFIPLIKAKHIYWELPAPLVRLFPSSERLTIIQSGKSLATSDYHIPLMSLPRRLGITLDNLPTPWNPLADYHPQKQRNKIKVGLIWSGKPTPTDRSINIAKLLPHLSHPDASLFSFQVDKKKEAIEPFLQDGLITDLSSNINDFYDTARHMQRMDLIISVDTGPAHLAGILGIPAWILVHYTSDWRWRTTGDRSPWYPNIHLFKQRQWNDWNPVLKQLRKAFLHLLPTKI